MSAQIIIFKSDMSNSIIKSYMYVIMGVILLNLFIATSKLWNFCFYSIKKIWLSLFFIFSLKFKLFFTENLNQVHKCPNLLKNKKVRCMLVYFVHVIAT